VQIATVVVVAVDVSTFYSYYTDCTASFAFADEYLLLLFRVLVYWNVVVAVIEIVAAVAELVEVVAAAASDLAVMMMTREVDYPKIELNESSVFFPSPAAAESLGALLYCREKKNVKPGGPTQRNAPRRTTFLNGYCTASASPRLAISTLAL
jgi:hypothetical protein